MKRRRVAWCSCLLGMAFVVPLAACLWDYDTLAMERRKFPGTLELITGKFLRHSPEFYQWRITDRTRRIAQAPDALHLYDDLAVAYDKTGDSAKAIETILKKERRSPGLYETYANLGTFFIHAGQLAQGIAEIDKAIAINPDAHFGRELYQRHLAAFLISKRSDDGAITLPLDPSVNQFDDQGVGFRNFVFDQLQVTGVEQKSQATRRAITGILGMMKFGNHQSPVLLESLADLLLSRHDSDAKRLAARAYLKASYEASDQATQQAYRRLSADSLEMQTVSPNSERQLSFQQLEQSLAAELAEAEEFFQSIRADELRWIAANKNVDEEFSKKYYREPTIGADFAARRIRWPLAIVVSCAVLIGLAWLADQWRRKR